jgi:hypothetical protein
MTGNNQFLAKPISVLSMYRRLLFLSLCVFYLAEKGKCQPRQLERRYDTFYQSWFSLNLTNDLTDDFGAGLDILHWRQSVEDGSWNIFRAYQFQAYFFWLHYYMNDYFTFSISPFTYIHEVPLADDNWHFLREPQLELRFLARVLNSQRYDGLGLDNRLTFEYRYRTSSQDPGVFWPEYRFLYRLRLSQSIFPNTQAVFRNEIFIAFGPYIQYNIFDLNIAFIGIETQLSEKVQFRIGYTNFFEMQRSGQDFNIVHALNMGVSVKNIFKPIRELVRRAGNEAWLDLGHGGN